jgi:MarR family transcriptional regulator, organic hydroperoxide resistance regulator
MTARKPAEAAQAQAMLRHWLKDVPNDRLAHLVKDATRGLQRGLQRRLAEHAVSFGHWSFLRILWDTDGLTQRELSERAGVMEPTTFSALAAMEKLGYISRVPAPEGGRKVFIHLTETGKALKEVLVPMAEAVNEIAVSGVREADIAATRRTLLAMVANLAEDEIAAAKDDKRLPSTRAVARRLVD